MDEEDIFNMYESGELSYIDAIEELQKIGYSSTDAKAKIDALIS